MTGKKWLLVVAAVAFVGWIVYLGSAVLFHRLNPPDLVSRSQIAQAEFLLVVDVTVAEGKPASTAEVKRRLSDFGPTSGPITVVNLPDATTQANAPLAAGEHLLSLVSDGPPGQFRIAGWPRGLGESVVVPGREIKQVVEETGEDGKTRFVEKSYSPPRFQRPPVAYPWSESVQKQMKGLGYKW